MIDRSVIIEESIDHVAVAEIKPPSLFDIPGLPCNNCRDKCVMPNPCLKLIIWSKN